MLVLGHYNLIFVFLKTHPKLNNYFLKFYFFKSFIYTGIHRKKLLEKITLKAIFLSADDVRHAIHHGLREEKKKT